MLFARFVYGYPLYRERRECPCPAEFGILQKFPGVPAMDSVITPKVRKMPYLCEVCRVLD